MKNYYYNAGERLFSVNTEEDFPNVDFISSGINIDYSYRIKEDGVLRAKDNKGNITEYEVKENDVVLIMYSNTENYYDKQIIIIRDNKLAEYFKVLDICIEERNKKCMCKECDACDSCNCCKKIG